VTIGIASLISSILIHPSVSRYWRADILNYQDVSLQYAVWSAVLGVVVLTVGFTFFKVNSSRMGHVVTLFTTLSIIVFQTDCSWPHMVCHFGFLTPKTITCIGPT
jgi:multidrug transporter EmrE-like cation transporter